MDTVSALYSRIGTIESQGSRHERHRGASVLTDPDIEAISIALTRVDPRDALLEVFDHIAAQRVGAILFSASTCRVESLEVTRVYSTRPDVYPVGATTNKRETSWGRHVLQQRRVFVGEGSLAMAAAFDDQVAMERVGIQSIVNVPIVIRDICLGVLNFGFGVDRVEGRQLTAARLLGIVAGGAFAWRVEP